MIPPSFIRISTLQVVPITPAISSSQSYSLFSKKEEFSLGVNKQLK